MSLSGTDGCSNGTPDGARWVRSDLRATAEAFVAESLPGVTMTHVEATYLAWLDVHALGLDDPELDLFRWMIEEFRIARFAQEYQPAISRGAATSRASSSRPATTPTRASSIVEAPGL